MKTDKLNQLWSSQRKEPPAGGADHIVKKANKQRNRQWIAIAVMSVTVVVLVVYAAYYAANPWNTFNLGLLLMISSLAFRIILEFTSLYRKENQLISLDYTSFQKYLKKHYKMRRVVNYLITPICFGIYIYGFTLLLPYFKREFSQGFYTYLLVSGFVSLFVIALIVVNSILKERHFLKHLK